MWGPHGAGRWGFHRHRTHLLGVLPAAPVQKEEKKEDEEGGCKHSCEGALQGAPHSTRPAC